MAISSGFSDMYLKDICRNVTEFQIATHYLGITSLPYLINAPYRSDLTPSLSVYEYGNKVRYKDFGTGESGGIFDLLMKLWRCSFEKCISHISNDIIKIQQKIWILFFRRMQLLLLMKLQILLSTADTNISLHPAAMHVWAIIFFCT